MIDSVVVCSVSMLAASITGKDRDGIIPDLVAYGCIVITDGTLLPSSNNILEIPRVVRARTTLSSTLGLTHVYCIHEFLRGFASFYQEASGPAWIAGSVLFVSSLQADFAAAGLQLRIGKCCLLPIKEKDDALVIVINEKSGSPYFVHELDVREVIFCYLSGVQYEFNKMLLNFKDLNANRGYIYRLAMSPAP
jgi:hypothetical protein